MIELALAGGLVVAVLGVVEVSLRAHEERRVAPVTMIRWAMEELEGGDLDALRAEFRRGGVTPPVHRPLKGFLF